MTAERHSPWSRRRDRLITAAIGLGAGFYLLLFWSNQAPWKPAWFRRAQAAVQEGAKVALTGLSHALGGREVPAYGVSAATSVTLGVMLPWLFMALIGRGRPRDIGVRAPNRTGWRIMAVGYLLALPWLFVMARSPATRGWYRHEVAKHTALGMLGMYLVVLTAEHFLFHGVLLGLLRRERRWPVVPEPALVTGSAVQRVLRFFGLAQPAGDGAALTRARRWLGLPEACVGALAIQAILFAACHANKAPLEALLSFPGGLSLGYVAYRSDSVLCPFLLHVATGATALGFIWLSG